MRLATEAALFPDAVVNFTLTAHVAVRRLLDAALKAFISKREAIVEERKRARELREEQRRARRAAFMAKQEEKRREFSENLRQRVEAGEDVDGEEFEEEEYESEGDEEDGDGGEDGEGDEGDGEQALESNAQARDRIRLELTEVHERVAEAAQAAADSARDEFRIATHTISADAGMARVFACVVRRLKPVLEDRDALLDYCFKCPLPLAELLVERAVCGHSVFGTWDPVDVYHDRAASTVIAPR